MKNSRYMSEAIAQLRRDGHLPNRVLDNLTDEDIDAVTHSVYNVCQDIARVRQEVVEFELEDDLVDDLMRKAHERDVTLNELIEQALEQAVAEEDFAQRFYEVKHGDKALPWSQLTDDDRAHWRKLASNEPYRF